MLPVDAPSPTNVKQVCSFLGAVQLYSDFIPGLADLVELIQALLRDGRSFEWGGAAESF